MGLFGFLSDLFRLRSHYVVETEGRGRSHRVYSVRLSRRDLARISEIDERLRRRDGNVEQLLRQREALLRGRRLVIREMGRLPENKRPERGQILRRPWDDCLGGCMQEISAPSHCGVWAKGDTCDYQNPLMNLQKSGFFIFAI